MIMDLIESIKEHEGFRGDVYDDHLGNPTVGYGTLMPINEHEGTMLLKSRLENSMKELTNAKPIIRTVPDSIRAVLFEMAYQMGVPNLTKFHKMWIAIQKDDWHRMTVEMKDSRWYKQTPRRADALIERVLRS